MKKLLSIMLSLTLGVGAVSAQEAKASQKAQPKKTEVVKFVTDIDCEGCAKKVYDVILCFRIKLHRTCTVGRVAEVIPRKSVDFHRTTAEANKN